MRIDSVEFLYASMPHVTLEGDGSQDALLVRVVAGDLVGWGECEASPLTSIAAFVTPRSHGVCQPVAASVLGERLDGPQDIARIAALVRRNSMDLLQAPHTFSGIEIALWDLLGRRLEEPVWRLLGHRRPTAKTAYASLLFGDDPQETLARARGLAGTGFRAAKFGWGPYGQGSVQEDADHLLAAREGLGDDVALMVDAGQVWVEDVEAAARRLPALEAAGVVWLEEPFTADAYGAYADLARRCGQVGIAGGEGASTPRLATNLVDFAGVRFVQVDAGRIGGIGAAHEVLRHADARGVTFVNHTFTSHLALSASLQPYAGAAAHRWCEYPADPKSLALDLADATLPLGPDGTLAAPDAPGLGVGVDAVALAPYLVEVEVRVGGADLFTSGRPLRADAPATVR